MKTFPLKLTDDQHKELKIRAAEAGKSLHRYILDHFFGDVEYLDLGAVKDSNIQSEHAKNCKCFICK